MDRVIAWQIGAFAFFNFGCMTANAAFTDGRIRWSFLVAGLKGNNSFRNIAKLEKIDHKCASKIYQINFLSPKIKEAILDGTQPRALTLAKLIKGIPIRWQDQEKLYGF